jgi:transposase
MRTFGTLPIEDALEVQYKEKPAYMKKNSNSSNEGKKAVVKEQNEQKLFLMKLRQQQPMKGVTVGLDLGDRGSSWCALDADGEVIARGEVVSEKQTMELFFSRIPVSRVALEVGTHSPWVSRLLEKLGHEVIVANAHRVKLISASSKKNDRRDAEFLARLARADVKLLSPIRHRGEALQADLVAVRVRAQLVELRTDAINTARGLVKSFGQRLQKCDADNLGKEHAKDLEPAIRGHVERLLGVIEGLTKQIQECDQELKKISEERYKWETEQLGQVAGVGPITALTFVLTLDDPTRFEKSRDVGCYVGLRPKSDQSGASNPEMRISKEGDGYLRQLLVQCSHYILSKRGRTRI